MNTPADHEAYLRAALHAAADSLEPRGDGLDRIRARLQRRPRVVAWMLAAGDALRLRAPAAVQDGFYRLSAGFWTAWERFSPAPASGKHRSRAQGWLRPLAAMAAVIFIVAAGTYVAIDVSTAVSPSSSSSHPHSGQPGPAGGQPAASPTQSPTHPVSGSGPATHRTSPSPTCTPSASPQPSESAPASPSPNPSASPTASSTPSSPAPTDSPSTATDAQDSRPHHARVTAARLTAFTSVSSRSAATLTQDPCAPPATSPVTPTPSTS